MAAQRGHGRPSENRETQVFFGCVITKMFSKIHLDIITTIEEHYITVGGPIYRVARVWVERANRRYIGNTRYCEITTI